MVHEREDTFLFQDYYFYVTFSANEVFMDSERTRRGQKLLE